MLLVEKTWWDCFKEGDVEFPLFNLSLPPQGLPQPRTCPQTMSLDGEHRVAVQNGAKADLEVVGVAPTIYSLRRNRHSY